MNLSIFYLLKRFIFSAYASTFFNISERVFSWVPHGFKVVFLLLPSSFNAVFLLVRSCYNVTLSGAAASSFFMVPEIRFIRLCRSSLTLNCCAAPPDPRPLSISLTAAALIASTVYLLRSRFFVFLPATTCNGFPLYFSPFFKMCCKHKFF